MDVYSNANVKFADGFQKDVIQNAVGARKTNRWKNWMCDISIIDNEKGRFLVVEDKGTLGLMGRNMTLTEINEKMDREEELPPTERLARFCSMNNSGGNQNGGGLYGVGKSVYMGASKQLFYYFDSLREDGLYLANQNKRGLLYEKAFENDEAATFIREKTGFAPKMSCGTRIIIVDPIDEIVDAVQSGSIIPFIQNAWWRTMEKFKDDSAITVNSRKVSIPSVKKQAVRHYELSAPYQYKPGYTVKHFGLYEFDKPQAFWQGISYYRKGMKIGNIELSDVPAKISGRLWGYIEVDEEWENALAEIEDNVHFGVSKRKKNTTVYQTLKGYVNQKVREQLIAWGEIKDKEVRNQKIKEELEDLAAEVQSEFARQGFKEIGSGSKKPDFSVRWQNVVYPRDQHQKMTREVTRGDDISFGFKIVSRYAMKRKFSYKLFVKGKPSGRVCCTIAQGTADIEGNGGIFAKNFTYTVKRNTAEPESKNEIVLVVKAKETNREQHKSLYFFYDMSEPEKQVRKNIKLMAFMDLPHKNSRRVNFGDVIRNLTYHIENKYPEGLSYVLRVRMHNVTDTSAAPLIANIARLNGEVGAFDDAYTEPVQEIVIDKDTYSRELSKGRIELRADLIANSDSQYFERGDKITSYAYTLYLNMDEQEGYDFKIEMKDEPDNPKRSWCRVRGSDDRTIFFNIGHPSYKQYEDYEDFQRGYLREEMTKQYLMLYLEAGQMAVFVPAGQKVDDPVEAVQVFMDKMEEVNFRMNQQ